MTTRDAIDAEHKRLFGRKGRKDHTNEQLIQRIEEKTGQPFKVEPEKVEEPETIVPQVTVVKSGTKKEDDNTVRKGTLHKVYINGKEQWWTKPVLNVALATAKANVNYKVEFPENTEFHTDATINKCQNC